VKIGGNMRGLRRLEGHTLTETVVALGIVAIVSGLAFTGYQLIVEGAHLQGTVYLLSQDLQYVRERALSTGVDYWVYFDISHSRYVAFKGDTIVLERNLQRGVTFSILDDVNSGACNLGEVPDYPVTFPGDSLVFYRDGEATEGSLYLSDGRSQVAIYINPLGRIAVCLWDGGTWHE